MSRRLLRVQLRDRSPTLRHALVEQLLAAGEIEVGGLVRRVRREHLLKSAPRLSEPLVLIVPDRGVERLEGPVSILVATRDEKLAPHFTRANAARFDAAAGEATVTFPREGSERLLANLNQNGQIAVTAVDFLTFQTRQIKGRLLRLTEPAEVDLALAGKLRQLCIPILEQFFGHSVAAGWNTIPIQPGVSVVFRVTDIFDQSPRPGAGERIA